MNAAEMNGADYDVILKDICNDSNVFKLQNGVPLVLGRSRETKIKDTRWSRTQCK